MKALWKYFAALAMGLQALPVMAQEEAKTEPAGPAMTHAPVVDCCNACNSCQSCGSKCQRGGFIGGFEFLLLKPYNSEGNAPIFDAVAEIANEAIAFLDPTIGSIAEPDWDLEPSYRLWLGYQTAEGLGIRATYFEFDNDTAALSTLNTGGFFGIASLDIGLGYAIEARTFDLEVIQSFQPNPNWWLLVGAGYRYAEYKESNSLSATLRGNNPGEVITLPNLLSTGFDSQSHGLTLSGEARRLIGRNFALFAGTRGSILFGDETEAINVNLGALGAPQDINQFINTLLTENEEDNVKFLFEVRMGGEVNYELRNGSIAFARLSAEAQFWDNVTGTPLLDSNGSFGLFGLGLGIGLYR